MCSEYAIKVETLSKVYQIYDKPRDRLLQMLVRGRKTYFSDFWALKDVSFDVKKGETFGIVGSNGSGKSTLLQMICGTLNPTRGNIRTNGRIAALLELGSGFNPEFTGRENVYLNGSIIGLSSQEIDMRFSEIVAFAGIGKFIEQPVKTYSSGMLVRLAFAVAINSSPEILIVDEALSVGDELFQRKCFSRIEAIRASGATILFVSHSAAAIVELCDRAMLLDAGEKLSVGIPKKIIGRYQKLLFASADKRDVIREQIRRLDEHVLTFDNTLGGISDSEFISIEHNQESQEVFDPNLVPSSTIEYEQHGAHIETPAILNLAGEKVNNLIGGKTYRYTYAVRFTESVNNVRFGMLIKTVSGVELGGATSDQSINGGLAAVDKGVLIHVEFRFNCSLTSGIYFLNAGVYGNILGEFKHLHRIIDAFCFRVVHNTSKHMTGIVDFACFPEIFSDK
jgi:lipopolysaccharide transport system ATP-binding protein